MSLQMGKLGDMHIADPLGVPGAPAETLEALTARFTGSDLTGARLTLITDDQGRREAARYAALVTVGEEAVLTAAAFGPRFGDAGTRALRLLAAWARDHGLENVKETVLNPSDFTRVVGEPDAAEVAHLIAAANPSDLGIYLK